MWYPLLPYTGDDVCLGVDVTEEDDERCGLGKDRTFSPFDMIKNTSRSELTKPVVEGKFLECILRLGFDESSSVGSSDWALVVAVDVADVGVGVDVVSTVQSVFCRSET